MKMISESHGQRNRVFRERERIVSSIFFFFFFFFFLRIRNSFHAQQMFRMQAFLRQKTSLLKRK